jgi:hypothetical protein
VQIDAPAEKPTSIWTAIADPGVTAADHSIFPAVIRAHLTLSGVRGTVRRLNHPADQPCASFSNP